MQVKTKLVLKTIVPVSLVIGFIQFLFTAVIPKQLDLAMPAGVMATATMSFSMLNVFVCIFLALKLSAKADAANSDESGDTDGGGE
jgi:hypothetical protein